ncbi:hypothetical protein BofuT4_P004700.1 [Botrytis cinerea T4]|uniref:2EXR domain-containing protein n=1 Tax=Botryotinia fuckeliana (strain T4) TaxID=999810 RepID=G2Y3S1_BOTF4|nr:hypothetical protein BofuT4_P004700.1 [Botrytis cinerea T4]
MTLAPKTFPQFSLLPLELRLKIWHLALPPRIIILPRLSYKPLRPNHSQPPTPRNPYEKREWLARNQPTYHGLPISPLEYATTRYHIPSILTTNRDAYTAIRPLYRRMFNWRSYETDYWDNEGQVWFNPEIDILALGMQLPDVLGWSCVFRYREDLARVRFLALYDIVGERSGESRNIDSQEEIEELMRGLPSTVIQLASLCVRMEKFYWVVEEEEEGGERTFREELTLRRGEMYVRRSFDFLRMRRPESVAHTQDSTEPLQPEKIRTVLDSKEKREKLRVERERWQRTICLRSTRELKIERDMYKFPSTVPFIVDDYTEAALDRQVKIFRNMQTPHGNTNTRVFPALGPSYPTAHVRNAGRRPKRKISGYPATTVEQSGFLEPLRF